MLAEVTEDILKFWFGSLQEGFSSTHKRNLWYAFDAEFDEEIRHRFGELLGEAAQGKLDRWQEAPRSCLAYILLTDQFTRNIQRGTKQAFALDSLALDAARHGILEGFDQHLELDERSFFYMPFEHSENLLDQHTCVGLFSQLRDQTPQGKKHLSGNFLRFAQQHRDIIQRFGRFPHRNKVLGRESSAAEITFLQDATHYGQ